MKAFACILLLLFLSSCTAYHQSRGILSDLTSATQAAASMGGR